MNSLFDSGPCIFVVLLRCDGTAQEVLVDMSPTQLPLVNLLGGPITINGQYIPEEVIVVKRQVAQVPNPHVLPPPFERDRIKGDIGFVRMNKHSIPESFRLDEYHALSARYLVTRRRVYQKKKDT